MFEWDLTEDGGPLDLFSIGNIAKAFAAAAANADMGTLERVVRKRKSRDGKPMLDLVANAEITPRVLRHTCITRLLQCRVPIRKIAGFVGATAEIIETVYGHPIILTTWLARGRPWIDGSQAR